MPCAECMSLLCIGCRKRFKYPITYGLGIGSSDLIGLIEGPGQFLAAEIKTVKGRLTDEQEAWQDMIRRYGGKAITLRSEDEARKFLQEVEEENDGRRNGI